MVFLQHDLAGAVKTDCSFWTIGETSYSSWLQTRNQAFISMKTVIYRCDYFRFQRLLVFTMRSVAEDRVMHVTLQKREKGQPWPSAIAGHAPLDPLKTEQEKQRLMLERFQTEVCFT